MIQISDVWKVQDANTLVSQVLANVNDSRLLQADKLLKEFLEDAKYFEDELTYEILKRHE